MLSPPQKFPTVPHSNPYKCSQKYKFQLDFHVAIPCGLLPPVLANTSCPSASGLHLKPSFSLQIPAATSLGLHALLAKLTAPPTNPDTFLARHSSTFSPSHCFSSLCQLVPQPDPNPCNHTLLHGPCRYEYVYSDGSKTSGFFSKETTTLNTSSGRAMKLRSLAFGCGFHVSGPSVPGRVLTEPMNYLTIGDVVSLKKDNQSRISYTPLLTDPVALTFYYIAIKGVFNGVKLTIDPPVWLIDELCNGGTLPRPTPGDESTRSGFDLCVNVTGVSRPRLPRLNLELGGASVFSPPRRNYFIEIREGVRCYPLTRRVVGFR
ncbi:hypothetical protein NC652_025754 [Populus alba x Populus x berolinensis]|nr:hypothetical protein NC652_025754 [Populus alba x Populus x berolinensis]